MKRNMKKIAFALLLNLFLFFILMFVLDVTGTISLENLFRTLGLAESDPTKIEDPYFLAQEEIEKQFLAIILRENDLEQSMETFRSNLQFLQDKGDQLDSQERLLRERERRTVDDMAARISRSENIRTVAIQYMNMPPQQAVERLQAQTDDLLIIDILRAMDADAEEGGRRSIVPYYLSLMEPERAAAVQRKMANISMLTNDADF
jgi:flagellar protein FlbB